VFGFAIFLIALLRTAGLAGMLEKLGRLRRGQVDPLPVAAVGEHV
jgi:hypothetical protein